MSVANDVTGGSSARSVRTCSLRLEPPTRPAFGRPPSPRGGGIRRTATHIQSVSQRTQNTFHHASEIGIDVRIPESKNSKTLQLQKGVASLIGSSTLRHSMLTAIRFDNQLGSERNEVDNVPADGCLSPEMKAEGFQFAQPHPQFDFLRRETFAKCASIFVCQGSPLLRGTPSHAMAFPASGRDLSYPSTLWGGWHVASAANDVTGGGSARSARTCAFPPDRPSAGHPPRTRGRDKKEAQR